MRMLSKRAPESAKIDVLIDLLHTEVGGAHIGVLLRIIVCVSRCIVVVACEVALNVFRYDSIELALFEDMATNGP